MVKVIALNCPYHSWVFLNSLMQMMCSNSKYCTEAVSCVALCSFGHFFHTVIAGWDDSECQKAYDVVCQHSCILKTLKYVVTGNPGNYSEHLTSAMFCYVFIERDETDYGTVIFRHKKSEIYNLN